MRVNICGIIHDVIECADDFNVDILHLGQIDFKGCRIKINKDSNEQIKNEALCHEMIHGILVHIGRDDLSNDESLVQALGNAICQGFTIKELSE